MRILLLAKDFPSESRPTAGIFLLRLAEALRGLSHEIEVLRIVPHAPALGRKWGQYNAIPSSDAVSGIPVHTIRALIPPRMIAMEYLPLQLHRRVQQHIARFRADVLHANMLIPCGQVAVRHHLPRIVTAHGGDAYLWPTWRPGLFRAAREAVTGATRITAVSSALAQAVRNIADRTIDVIFNGADERVFYARDRDACRERLGLPQDRPVIAYVGNLFRNKGIFDLIDAIGGMRQLNPVLVLAGEGMHGGQAETSARDAGIDARFTGRLDPEGVAALFGACDVATLPSFNEGLPNVVCEAMLSARAVVATTVGGIPEIIRNGESGLLVPPHQPGQLREALTRVLQDGNFRHGCENNARRFAAANLTWNVSARGYERVFEAALTEYAQEPSSNRRHTRHAS
jgi:teichuronic acid biosynthesis glycosyltransferase TuaC